MDGAMQNGGQAGFMSVETALIVGGARVLASSVSDRLDVNIDFKVDQRLIDTSTVTLVWEAP